MPNYRRYPLDSRPVFLTVKTLPSSPMLVNEWPKLRAAMQTVQARRPFETIAIVVLPDHFHALWKLPRDDEDFSTRISVIKTLFSKSIDKDEPALSASRIARRERGIWQRRFYEHTIRDDRDLSNHIDYIHFNPVKHGYAKRTTDWPHSSFHRFVKEGALDLDWAAPPSLEIVE
jgi:putative transposase